MKREIFCHACALEVGRVMPFRQVSAIDAAIAAQESVVKVYGKLTHSVSCDFCNKPLNKGDTACCQSIVAMGGQYYQWEHEHIEPRQTEAAR